jgi:hypothetical protein
VAVADDVSVTVNARQRVDLTLQVGQVTETIQVTAGVAAVESDSTDRGQIIHLKQIVELPLNGRNYADLALLTTGVRRSDYAFANPPREGSFNVNGQRSLEPGGADGAGRTTSPLRGDLSDRTATPRASGGGMGYDPAGSRPTARACQVLRSEATLTVW